MWNVILLIKIFSKSIFSSITEPLKMLIFIIPISNSYSQDYIPILNDNLLIVITWIMLLGCSWALFLQDGYKKTTSNNFMSSIFKMTETLKWQSAKKTKEPELNILKGPSMQAHKSPHSSIHGFGWKHLWNDFFLCVMGYFFGCLK